MKFGRQKRFLGIGRKAKLNFRNKFISERLDFMTWEFTIILR